VLENGVNRVAEPYNMSIDADPQQQEAAPPQMLMVRSSSRYMAPAVFVVFDEVQGKTAALAAAVPEAQWA
jgi:hypothetical protein